jgi:hypothetical protein
MLPRLAIVAASALALATACTQNAQPVTLRSLEANGRFSFLCLGTRDPDAAIPIYEPRSVDDCPDTSLIDGESRHAFAMVTQTTRGEVAMVDLTGGYVVDAEPTVPGFNFFAVGANPTGITSTPGSLATFVGVGEVGKEGIFAIPTPCTLSRPMEAPLRDLTTWPACRLPYAPGEMTIVIDGPSDTAMPDVYRQACNEGPTPAVPQSLVDANGNVRTCPADLSTETKDPGRRKLVVALPQIGELEVIDAQELLERPAGEYEPCKIEQRIKLSTLPTLAPGEQIEQIEPQDLLDISTEKPAGFAHPIPDKAESRPAGFTQVDDSTTHEHALYVADRNVPLIHVFDTADACNLKERPQLLPVSFADPNRIVTTRKVAASPLTVPESDPKTGILSPAKRYLYAIDDIDIGSVMIFDISPGGDRIKAIDRTPILRPRSALLPFEPPDRIAFDAPAEDIAFALRDHVAPDPTTGAQQIGALCDPDPSHAPTSPGALYRPAADLSTGASPGFLRGLFGFVALASGHVAVVDVQDFDAPCRRPISSNPDPTAEDFRGCVGDLLPANKQYVLNTVPTVTQEVSCRVVEPHRARSATAFRNDTSVGIHAPSLRAFPTLVSDLGRSLPQNHTDGRDNPRMLAADFSRKEKAQVWIGTQLYAPGDATYPLVTDPARADQSSLALSFREPRAYAPQENFSAVYEGVLVPARQSGMLIYPDSVVNDQLSLNDGGFSFCSFGVEDVQLAKDRAGQKYGLSGDAADRFANGTFTTEHKLVYPGHADYVEITSDLLDERDNYWVGKARGATCGGASAADPGAGYRFCLRHYGTSISATPFRDFRIAVAEAGRLTLESRNIDANSQKAIRLEDDQLTCCFPQIISYEVRASKEWIVTGSSSGFRHDIDSVPGGTACTISTNPLRKGRNGRVIQISCAGNDCAPDETGRATIGRAANGEVACVVGGENTLAKLTDPEASACVFSDLAGRFVIYRGNLEALRDYRFDWTITGGFSPQLVNLAATDSNTSPRSMSYSPERGGLVIADGSAQGLVVVDLSTFAITLSQ